MLPYVFLTGTVAAMAFLSPPRRAHGLAWATMFVALFVFIGQSPRTDWLEGFALRDDAGFVLSGRESFVDGRPPAGWGSDRDPFLLESSVPGVFVAGDVRFRSIKRIASAVGEGSMAVQFVHQYLASQ